MKITGGSDEIKQKRKQSENAVCNGNPIDVEEAPQTPTKTNYTNKEEINNK